MPLKLFALKSTTWDDDITELQSYILTMRPIWI